MARSTTSSNVGTRYRPLNAVLAGRTAGNRSTARSVRSSASVKSSVNHPVTLVPSITFVVRRVANSEREATSVVPLISFSWRATRTPSLVGDEVGLDEVGALQDGELVGGEGVLGSLAAGTPVADHRHVVATTVPATVPAPRVDDDHLGVVGRARHATVAAGVVVVVGDEQAPVAQRDDRLDGLQRRRRTDRRRRRRRAIAPRRCGPGWRFPSRSTTSSFATNPSASAEPRSTEYSRFVTDRGPSKSSRSISTSSPASDHEGVADHVVVGVGLVLPRAAGVALAPGVELVHEPAAGHGVVDERALDDRVQVAAVRRLRHRLEPAAAAHARHLTRLQVRVGRRLAVRELERRGEHGAGAVDVEDERAELLADPEAAVATTLLPTRCRNRRR